MVPLHEVQDTARAQIPYDQHAMARALSQSYHKNQPTVQAQAVQEKHHRQYTGKNLYQLQWRVNWCMKKWRMCDGRISLVFPKTVSAP